MQSDQEKHQKEMNNSQKCKSSLPFSGARGRDVEHLLGGFEAVSRPNGNNKQ